MQELHPYVVQALHEKLPAAAACREELPAAAAAREGVKA
jgi:hypothetical protein